MTFARWNIGPDDPDYDEQAAQAQADAEYDAMRDAEYGEEMERYKMDQEMKFEGALVEFIKMHRHEAVNHYAEWVQKAHLENEWQKRFSYLYTHEFVIRICEDWLKKGIVHTSEGYRTTIGEQDVFDKETKDIIESVLGAAKLCATVARQESHDKMRKAGLI